MAGYVSSNPPRNAIRILLHFVILALGLRRNVSDVAFHVQYELQVRLTNEMKENTFCSTLTDETEYTKFLLQLTMCLF